MKLCSVPLFLIFVLGCTAHALSYEVDPSMVPQNEKEQRELFLQKKNEVINLLKELGVSEKDVSIIDIANKNCGPGSEGILCFSARVERQTKFKDGTLKPGARLDVFNKKIQLIDVGKETLKIDGMFCTSIINFMKGSVCRCRLVKDHVYKGFTVRAPSQFIQSYVVAFYPEKKWESAGKTFEAHQGYSIDRDGKVTSYTKDTEEDFCYELRDE